jgi:hypothetical protein
MGSLLRVAEQTAFKSWQRRNHLPSTMGAALLGQHLHQETVSGDGQRLHDGRATT